ncbi:MAG: hypothetical protein GXP09_07440 [Gammaproteobacteria bacterium]|nr:hypothetical protein [Gammaproteobacteria bacterium]
MEEIHNIIKKYNKGHVDDSLNSLEDIKAFSLVFFKDVSEVYDCITRLKNTKRNPTGYSLDDAPIIALLVKIWKLLKEIIVYYEKDNAEIISLFERPLIESSVTASYLLKSNSQAIEDYRKISYKDRLRILRELKEGSAFYETKAGKRLLKSVQEKMNFEKLTIDDFQEQKRNRWRLQNKSFFDIFKEIEGKDLYACTYGMMSEAVHCSWNDSLDWCLSKNDDDTFDVYPFYQTADIRHISPTLVFCNRPYKLWLQHIDITDTYINDVLQWIENINSMIYVAFDELYDE